MPAQANSDVYVCREPNGTRIYQNTPGGDQCQRMNLEPVLSLPQPPGRGPAASSGMGASGANAARPAQQPSMTGSGGGSAPATQAPTVRTAPGRADPMAAARDGDRLRILEEELRQEEVRLQELLSGSSRQTDPGRQQEIARSQASIDALRREMTKVRR